MWITPERELTIEEQDVFETEKRALVGDRDSILRVVSAVRIYREAARQLLSSRYRDGECDAAALSTFEAACDNTNDIFQQREKLE